MRKRLMKSKQIVKKTDDMRPEYETSLIRGGVRGKYLKHYREGTNVVLLAPDVAEVFTTEKAVNDALRAYMRTKNIPNPPSI